MAASEPRKTQTITLTRVDEGHYRFAARGDFSLEETVYALEQVKAILLGIAKPTETFRLAPAPAEPAVPPGAMGDYAPPGEGSSASG